ncbi:MAG: FAD-dependent oxidoreductase [Cyanobacteria bacterium J06659_2]
METLSTEVLVVGGGTGGTAAAIQAARRGAQTILVSEFSWLGGMLTAAGVSAPDGNELEAWQTGLWGAFLDALEARHPAGLDHGWVSFFNFDPAIGAGIFTDWVKALPNLYWIAHQVPQEVLRQGDRVVGVQFSDYTIYAQITLDGTELGDLLALGEIPYRWGWEDRHVWQEPSAPADLSDLSDPLAAIADKYPVQAPTWVVVMQDFGDAAGREDQTERTIAPKIPLPEGIDLAQFGGAWANHGATTFLNYGRLPGNRFMINWPIRGNDYGHNLQQLVADAATRQDWLQSAHAHSQGFAHYIQKHVGQRYGLATDLFPQWPGQLGGGAFGLMPYYRESRRLQGLSTVTETDILPLSEGAVATLPHNSAGDINAIAIGNYTNDHHYPGVDYPLRSKSIRWGGRWTGTPFAIPYGALVPEAIDGFLVCDKNLSVSHLANGATRLQPVVLLIGQAAGMAAALCVEGNQQPRALSIWSLQSALLNDPVAPSAVVPLFNLSNNPQAWLAQQQHYLNFPEHYPKQGWDNAFAPSMPATDEAAIALKRQRSSHDAATLSTPSLNDNTKTPNYQSVSGLFQRIDPQQYALIQPTLDGLLDPCPLVTLRPSIEQVLKQLSNSQPITVTGWWNPSGSWLRVNTLQLSRPKA